MGDDDEDEDDDSDDDGAFHPNASKRKASKPAKRKNDKTANSRRPKASRPKSQSPSKASASTSYRSKPKSSNTNTGSSKQPHQQSESPVLGHGPPLSAGSSHDSAALLLSVSIGDDSDLEDWGGRRSSRRNKRSAIMPGNMWDWAARKPKPKKESSKQPKSSGGGGSSNESPSRELESPSREMDVEKSASPKLEADGTPVPLTSGTEPIAGTFSERPVDDEDVKPDIAALNEASTREISTGGNGNSGPTSSRTSPGLPLANIHPPHTESRQVTPLVAPNPSRPSHRHTLSAASNTSKTSRAAPDNDAMDVDPPPSSTPRASARPTLSPVASNSLDLLAQLASLGSEVVPNPIEPDISDEAAAQLLQPIPVTAEPSDAGDDPEDVEEHPNDNEPPEDDLNDDAADPTPDRDRSIARSEEDEQQKDEEDEGDSDDDRREKSTNPLNGDDGDEDPEGDEGGGDDDAEREQAAAADSDRDSSEEAPPKEAEPDPDQDGEPEIEAEQEVENEIQPTQRAEALEILAAMELKFALLRERIYLDKMKAVADEERLVLDGMFLSFTTARCCSIVSWW